MRDPLVLPDAPANNSSTWVSAWPLNWPRISVTILSWRTGGLASGGGGLPGLLKVK